MTSKQIVLNEYPQAECLHVPMSMAVAIYSDGKRIGNEAFDAEHAWESAARIIAAKVQSCAK